MQTIVNLVSAGIGIAWVPASLTLLQRPGVVYRPTPGAALRCETSLVWPQPRRRWCSRFVAHVAAAVDAAERRQSARPAIPAARRKP